MNKWISQWNHKWMMSISITASIVLFYCQKYPPIVTTSSRFYTQKDRQWFKTSNNLEKFDEGADVIDKHFQFLADVIIGGKFLWDVVGTAGQLVHVLFHDVNLRWQRHDRWGCKIASWVGDWDFLSVSLLHVQYWMFSKILNVKLERWYGTM